MTDSPHIPILVAEIIDLLDIQPDDTVLDGTIGFGGHSGAILKKLKSPTQLTGLDQDPSAIEFCKKKFPKIKLLHQNFSNIPKKKYSKILLDLGMSSFHIDLSGRGFSFQKDEPLDMRMNTNAETTAADILNTYSKGDLGQVFLEFGEIYRPEKLVENIVKRRPLATTEDLKSAIKSSFYFRDNRAVMMRMYAQIFQALRIEVNQELAVLQTFLETVGSHLKKGGRVAILTFHSLEDRLIKNFVRDHKDTFRKINKNVIQATQTEIRANSRAKSAKLRVFEKL